MMHSILLHPPGGDSGVQCRRYSARDKIAIISQICRIKRDTGVSYRAAAASVGVLHMLVICWHTLRVHFNKLNSKQLPRYSGHDDSCGQLEEVKEALLAWIFERREMGFAVLMHSVVIKAYTLLPVMEQKSFMAQWMVIHCFLKKYSIVNRLGTKVSQHPLSRQSKRQQSSSSSSSQCSLDLSVIFISSSTWTRCQYIFNASNKNA
jgi:hypothetical protein